MTEVEQKFTFDATSTEVALNLLDAQIDFGSLRATIFNTEPFTKEENQKPKYHFLTQMRPGLLTGILYRGYVLPVFSTEDGSCVLLHEVHIQDQEGIQRVKGPGRVARAIGLQGFDTRQVEVVEDTLPPVLRVV
jgi:hypothetical protein